MGLQYQNEHGDCPITLTVPNDASVKGWLITKCVVANQGGDGAIRGVTVTHDTVELASFYLAAANDMDPPVSTANGSVVYGSFGQGYFEREIGGGGATVAVIPKTRDVREAAGVWLAPGDVLQVAGTNCRASVTYQEEI